MNPSNYYISRGTEPEGPFSVTQLSEMFTNGEIADETLCAADGSQEWVPVLEIVRHKNMMDRQRSAGEARSAQPIRAAAPMMQKTANSNDRTLNTWGTLLVTLGVFALIGGIFFALAEVTWAILFSAPGLILWGIILLVLDRLNLIVGLLQDIRNQK